MMYVMVLYNHIDSHLHPHLQLSTVFRPSNICFTRMLGIHVLGVQ